MKITKRIAAIMLAVMLFSSSLISCAYMGPLVGGALGAGSGILLDPADRWRGATIGGLIGAIAGFAFVEIAKRSAMQSLNTGRPVSYNRGYYQGRVEPYGPEYNGYQEGTRCQKVRNRVWKNGVVVEDKIAEVCKSQTSRPGYMQDSQD